MDQGSTDDASDLAAGSAQGEFYDDDAGILLDWQWTSSWDGGACVELAIRNELATRVTSWRVDVTLDQGVDQLLHSDGGVVSLQSSGLDLAPYAGAEGLDAAGTREINLCAEPQVQVLGFTAAVTRDASLDGGGVVDGAFGMLEDATGSMFLHYIESSPGCFDIIVGNLTDSTLENWSLTALLDGPTELTANGDIRLFPRLDTPTRLSFNPMGEAAILGPYNQANTSVCMDPVVEPYALEVDHDGESPVLDPVADPDDDSTAPTLSGLQGNRTLNGETLQITFVASEPAVGVVCTADLSTCEATSTAGLLHLASFADDGDTYTVDLTDEAGNSAQYGPFGPFP